MADLENETNPTQTQKPKRKLKSIQDQEAKMTPEFLKYRREYIPGEMEIVVLAEQP